MINIAICDDEEYFNNKLKKIVQNYFDFNNIEIQIDVFDDGVTLLEALKNGEIYDLMLLDIRMKKLDGIKLGKIIRKESKWEETEIVYISSEKERAIEALPIRVFDFIFKPIDTVKIEKVLKKYLDVKNYKNEYIEIIEGSNKQKIFFDKIIYIGTKGRNNQIYTTDKTYLVTKTLSELENIFPKRNFMRIHKGFIINLDKIASYSYIAVTMINDKNIPIPQSKRVEFRKMFTNRKE